MSQAKHRRWLALILWALAGLNLFIVGVRVRKGGEGQIVKLLRCGVQKQTGIILKMLH